MNENVMNLLDAELEHAGEGTALSPQMLLLEQLRITPEKELKPMEFLFKGNLSRPLRRRGETTRRAVAAAECGVYRA